MFAILLSEKMDPFYQNIASFPTVFFTFFLVVCLLYWLVAILGWVEIEVLDFDIPDVDGDLGVNTDNDMGNADALAGLMLKLGLNGVPVTIIISIISLIGWTLCYYIVHFLMPWVPDGLLRYAIGLPIFIGTLYVSALLTAQIIKPLRKLFLEAAPSVKHIIGQTAVVRTSRVDKGFGEATMEDGGAGLLLKVRATGDETFVKGDRVVLVEYIEKQGIYRVVSEHEFSGV